jgi:photosystem II stability/assembly factor-like uncharacterized protein
MSGRITDIEGVPGSSTFYVAAASGGIWKTTNHGTTFLPVFDREKVISMGDIAIAPSDSSVIYAGTGEEDSRNSISPGGGVYKSTDGGKTWKLVGLEETQHVGRIVVDPRDANVAYVAAVGHTWGPNRERGLYKTTDGGATWQLAKFVSDKAGFVDVALDPSNPDIVWATSWERVRGPYFLRSGGPGSALWKSVDAGKSWTQVKGGGLPATTLGRIGLAIAPSNPKVIYATVEADSAPNPKRGPAYVLKPGEESYGLDAGGYPRSKTQSGIYRSTDGGATWQMMWRYKDDMRPFYYSQIRVDPKNPERIYWMSSLFRFSDDGGRTERRGGIGVHGDWHALWIDPTNPDHWVAGNDGGIAVTWDKGGTLIHPNTMALGQFYQVSYDMQPLYRVCGGLQDNGSWCGPSRTTGRGIGNEQWFNAGGGDGFFTAQDPEEPNIVYSESQGGRINRLDVDARTITPIRRGPRGQPMEDSMIVARGDTTRPETPELSARLRALRERARDDSAKMLRFNWNTPFFISPHSRYTIYAAGNRVIKSVNRGDTFTPISPDLSTKDSLRIFISTKRTGGLTPDNSGAETHGTITALAESPVRAGLLFAGTDDGNLWLTRNDGGVWENLTGRFPGVPAKTWVSRIEPSRFDSGTVYVSFDNHRENDFAPYVFVSTDMGRSFRSIASSLPRSGPAFVHVVREDPLNRNLLYVGTDVGVYISMDRGGSWQRFMTGLPTVPVHDLKIHPRERELIAGTHGRSIWIVDVSPLQEMADSLRAKPVHVFAVKPAYQYTPGQFAARNGHMQYQGDNAPYGAVIHYRVSREAATTAATTTESQGDGGAAPRDSVRATRARIVITSIDGDTVRVLSGAGGAGLHRVVWDLRRPAEPLGPAALRDSIANARLTQQRNDSIKAAGGTVPSAEGERGAPNPRPAEAPPGASDDFGSSRDRGRRGPQVEAGEYLAYVTVGGRTERRVIKVVRLSDVSDASFF